MGNEGRIWEIPQQILGYRKFPAGNAGTAAGGAWTTRSKRRRRGLVRRSASYQRRRARPSARRPSDRRGWAPGAGRRGAGRVTPVRPPSAGWCRQIAPGGPTRPSVTSTNIRPPVPARSTATASRRASQADSQNTQRRSRREISAEAHRREQRHGDEPSDRRARRQTADPERYGPKCTESVSALTSGLATTAVANI